MAGEEIADILADEAFNRAFDEAIAPEETKEVAPDPVVEPVAEVPPVVPEPEPIVAPVVAPVAPSVDIEKLVAEAVAKATPAPAAAPVPEPEDPAVAEALRDLDENWPTQAVAVKALLKQAVDATRKEMQAEFQKVLEPLQAQIEPLQATSAASAQEQFNNAVKAVHPDAWDLLPKVDEWIAKQPEFLRGAYAQVLTTGTPAQVNEFFTQYKAATGTPAPPAADAADAAAKAARLKKMETPGTIRTSVTAEADPQDFDAGWEAGLKKAV